MRQALLERLDRSVWALLFVNLATILLAMIERWDFGEVVWIYWSQSIIIGAYNWRRIMELERFSTEGFKINDAEVDPTRATKLKTAFFFAFHYGMFHFVYFIFLCQKADPRRIFSSGWVLLCILAFLANHHFSYRHNREADRRSTPNIGSVMMGPYGRIIPMHLIIIFGAFLAPFLGGELLPFLIIKTGADLIAHIGKHKGLGKLTGPGGKIETGIGS
jgi:hypothetical protein